MINIGIISIALLLGFTACAELSPFEKVTPQISHVEPIQADVYDVPATEPISAPENPPTALPVEKSIDSNNVPGAESYSQPSQPEEIKVKDEVKEAIAIAKTVNQVANPTPFAPIVNIGLDAIGWILAGCAGLMNAIQRKKFNTLKGATSVIVQAINKLPDNAIGQVKGMVATYSQIVDKSADVHKVVKELEK